MSNIYQLEARQKIREEASTWIIKMDNGDYDAAELITWMQQSPYHAEVLFELANTWDNLDVLSELSAVFPLTGRTHRLPMTFATAASLLIAVVVFLGVTSNRITLPANTNPPVEMDEEILPVVAYETAVGENSITTLSDGTRITLNTRTRIEVRYTDRQRSIDLHHGEAHFDVSPDKDRPLSVTVAGRVVRAVGTSFNIELASSNEVRVLVTDGEVVIEDRSDNTSNDSLDVDTAIPLIRGEMLIISDNEEEIMPVDEAELRLNLSWMEGNLIFDGEPLEVAIAEISRYTHIEFRIEDEDIKKIRLAGLFKTGDIDGLLFALQDNFQIGHTRISEDAVLLGGAALKDQQ